MDISDIEDEYWDLRNPSSWDFFDSLITYKIDDFGRGIRTRRDKVHRFAPGRRFTAFRYVNGLDHVYRAPHPRWTKSSIGSNRGLDDH